MHLAFDHRSSFRFVSISKRGVHPEGVVDRNVQADKVDSVEGKVYQ